MMSKNVVGISIMSFLFIVSNIFLFGMADADSFMILYLLFAILFVGLAVFMVRRSFEGGWQYFFVVLSAIILVVSMSFFAAAMKEYSGSTKAIEQQRVSLNNDIAQLTADNKYYKDYSDYLTGQISVYKANTDALVIEIEKMKSDLLTIPPPAEVPAYVAPEPLFVLPAYFYEDDEDEDEWEEDDD